MKVLISLVLAVAQLFVFGFATPWSPPPVADARPLGQVAQLAGASTVQAQSEDTTRAAEFSAPFMSSGAVSGGTMRVQIDMFSGRPNPSWEITAQEAEQVKAMVRQLPERQAAARPEQLGYRGLILHGDGVRDLGSTRILIGGGIVIVEGFQGVRYLSDPDRGLERQIFQTGRTRLDPTDYAAFKSIAFP
jgi:hypothetical protein